MSLPCVVGGIRNAAEHIREDFNDALVLGAALPTPERFAHGDHAVHTLHRLQPFY